MPQFPASPLDPTDFLESWFPEAFAAAEAPPGAGDLDVRLGIQLGGEGGGEWVLHIDHGALNVLPGSREEAPFTYVQSVYDWRGALWGRRGGAVGKGAALLFRPGEAAPAAAGIGGAPSLAALGELAQLSGLIEVVVEEAEALWRVGFKLGRGEIPDPPTTKVSIAGEDATAMETGALDPMTAFMSGKIRVEGDMTLMMQMQAIQMQVAARAAQDESP